MTRFTDYYKARDQITEILKKDFIGPVTENEVLLENPIQYYIMGKLYPQNDKIEDLNGATNSILEDNTEAYDSSISLSNQNNPSSMGFTCTLKPNVKNLVVSGQYAMYEKMSYEIAIKEGLKLPDLEEGKTPPKKIWKRINFNYEESIPLPANKEVIHIDLGNGMKIQLYTNHLYSSGERIVTTAFINTNTADNKISEQSEKAAFQVEIKLSAPSNEAIFTSVDKKIEVSNDQELLELDMLYQEIICYGQGHGCAVTWDKKSEEPTWIASTYFPQFDLMQMKPAGNDNRIFSMKFLFEAPSDEIIKGLRAYIKQYGEWIDRLETSAETFNDRRRQSAKININKCRIAKATINKTIDELEKDAAVNGIVYKAFQLANKAMFLQRTQSLIKKKIPFDEDNIRWYPFQLAFILQEMISFIEPNGTERKKADLLWFPTGGGKTEAYLGISAFVLFLRRLKDPSDDGVTVIMRYTLRLLTLQQFERAAMMICACEKIRQEEHIGGNEYSIGLWVGGNLTPNHLKDAKASIRQQIRSDNGDVPSPEGNPCQIKVCPWCNTPLTAEDYHVDMENNRMEIHCPNKDCDFHSALNGLPIHIIDDAIYEYVPSFIIATVDKFAQITLNDRPAALFGITKGKNPPSLIIQDELHLISGPLGTMTGVYEAAITKLCEKNGIPAKVIASTATIRNAAFQIKQLYARDFTQFPPQGINMKDSFFAVEATEEERPARRYLGVLGIGTTATTTLIRVNAALLFATRYLKNCGFPDNVVDSFWTLTEYFNSLRELGGACTQILDDVQSRFGYLAKTKFSSVYPGVDPNERYDHYKELTSRMDNETITNVIQVELNYSYPSADAYHFILASNMISVGVDIDRLGAMVVVGQPKTNAEYIQATSRVGRSNPGLVITVYNNSRSRDRSHYEQFMKYHSSLYRYVEATSLTPFSDRARDRGLHALFVALCRYTIPKLRYESDAKNFKADDPEVLEIKKQILAYVDIVDPAEHDDVADELDEICDEWDTSACYNNLTYRRGDNTLLSSDDDLENRFRTMNSMRNVDSMSGIYIREEKEK